MALPFRVIVPEASALYSVCYCGRKPRLARRGSEARLTALALEARLLVGS